MERVDLNEYGIEDEHFDNIIRLAYMYESVLMTKELEKRYTGKSQY